MLGLKLASEFAQKPSLNPIHSRSSQTDSGGSRSDIVRMLGLKLASDLAQEHPLDSIHIAGAHRQTKGAPDQTS